MTERIIGDASMDEEGTILLDLRAELPGGGEGLSRFVYRTTHPRYQYVLDHLGGLAVGEVKGVMPFPMEEEP